MSTGNLSIAASVTGGQLGSRTFGPLSMMLTAAVDQTTVQSLAVGANTVTVPTGATLCVISGPNAAIPSPNPSSTAVLTLKGAAGDTGVVVSAKYPTVLTWDAAPASFVLNASATCTVELFFA